MIFGTDEKEVKSMETVTLKKEINWEKILGFAPKIKNRKEIWFFNELGKQISLTKIIKVKIGEGEYILNYYDSEEVEEIEIKNKKSILLLSLKYDKKTGKLKKKVNYNFSEIIIYFLETFFQKRIQNDKEFNSIKKMLEEYSEISLEISECAL